MSEDNNSVAAASDAAPAEASTEETVEAAATEVKPTAKMTKLLKLKVDGQEFDESLPFEVDENNKEHMDFLRKHLQLSKVSNKRMSESAKVKMQAEALIREFEDNPTSLFKKLDAKKARSAAEEFLLEQLEQEMMSPEERTRQEMMRKLQSYEETERQTKEQAEANQMAELQNQVAQNYDKTISEALAKSGLPKVPATVKRMAQLMYKNLELGLDLSPADLVDEVKKSYHSEFKELFGTGDASFILNMFGDDVANKIRKHDLQRLQSKQSMPSVQPRSSSQPSKEDRKAMSRDEWRDWLDKRVKN